MAKAKSGKSMGCQQPDNYMNTSKTTSASADAPTRKDTNTSVAKDSNRKWGSGEIK